MPRRRAARPLLVIMAKLPLMGTVKTRLGRDIGAVTATWFFRHAARAVMLRLAADRRWRTVLALAPDTGIATRCWPGHIPRLPQGGGDLGVRMQRVFDLPRTGSVIIIGTDIPQVRPANIAAAFKALGGGDAVLGPADDGGYWAVGLKRSPRVLRPFAGVRWSSPHAMGDTLANLAGRAVGFAATLNDVDDAGDYRAVCRWAGRLVLPVRLDAREFENHDK